MPKVTDTDRALQSRKARHADCCAGKMKDETVKYLLQTAAVMAVLMVALAAALVYLARAA